jgi:hypothetical protein
MNIIFLNAAIVSVIYFVIKLLEIKFVDKKEINIKLVFRDTLIVFFSVIVSYYLLEQIKPMIYGDFSTSTNAHPQVFTDNPSF